MDRLVNRRKVQLWYRIFMLNYETFIVSNCHGRLTSTIWVTIAIFFANSRRIIDFDRSIKGKKVTIVMINSKNI